MAKSELELRQMASTAMAAIIRDPQPDKAAARFPRVVVENRDDDPLDLTDDEWRRFLELLTDLRNWAKGNATAVALKPK